ncbi:MAG TPA: ABC transporter permease [Fimbriimonas sp.]
MASTPASVPPPNVEFTIEPPRFLLRIDGRELWRFRDLFLVLAWRDVSVRYKQTALGALWAIFQPLVTMLIFTFVFHRMANVQSGDGTPYPVFLYLGLLVWQYYSGTVTKASESMVENQNMVQKVYFPRLVLPASTALVGFVDLAFASVVLAGVMAWFGYAPHWQGIAILPILLATLLLSALGLGLFFSSLNVKYRDVRYALPFLIQTLMYVTPVIYPVRMLDPYPLAKALMVWLNPIAGVVTNLRAGLLGAQPIDWPMMAISFGMSVVFFLGGLYVFRSTERYFADIV